MPQISLQQAKTMINLYKSKKAAILASGVDINILANSETFDISEINALISQPNCKSFRIYYGMSDDLNIHSILIGVDSNGNGILASESPVILEDAKRCPPFCSNSELTE